MGLNDPLSEFDEPGKSEEARSEATPAVGKYAWVPDFIGKHLRGTSVRARMAKGVLWSVIAGVFTRGLFVVLSIVIARLLGEVEFGKWGMVQATVGVLANLAGMGVGQTLTKHLAELRNGDPVRAGRVFALAASQAILANFLVAIGCFCLADILAWRVLRSPGMASPLALSVLIAVTLGFAMVLECALAGFEAFRKIAHVKFAEMIATFIVMVALTKLFGLT